MSKQMEMDKELHDLISLHRAWLERESHSQQAFPQKIPLQERRRDFRRRGIFWMVAYGVTLFLLVAAHMLWLDRSSVNERTYRSDQNQIELFPTIIEQNISRAWLEVAE